jgi:hypothetical protein
MAKNIRFGQSLPFSPSLSPTPLRSQLVGEANDLIDRSTRRPVQEDNDQHTEGTASQRDENSLSQRKRSRVPSQDSSSGNQSKNTKRSRRDLETAIKRCLVAGLYMNAARFLSHLLPFLPLPSHDDHDHRRCVNETAYRSMPFQISKDHGLSQDWQLQDLLGVGSLRCLSASC